MEFYRLLPGPVTIVRDFKVILRASRLLKGLKMLLNGALKFLFLPVSCI